MNLKKFTFVALLATATGAAAYAGLADQVAKNKKTKQPSYSARSVATALAARDYSPFPSGTDTEEIAYKSWVTAQGYVTEAVTNGLASEAWVNEQGFLTSADLDDYATDQDLVELATAFDGIVDGVTNALTVTTGQGTDENKTTIGLRNGVSATVVDTEVDPTVPAWAKADNKPSYNFNEIGNTPTTLAGYGITDACTSNQIETIVSGATSGKMDKDTDGVNGNVAKIDANGNAVDGGTALSTIVSGAAAGATAYQLPSGGIPTNDLASAVVASLNLANTAVQPAALDDYALKAQMAVNTSTAGRATITLKTGTAATVLTDFIIYGDDAGNTPYRLGVDANGQLYITTVVSE